MKRYLNKLPSSLLYSFYHSMTSLNFVQMTSHLPVKAVSIPFPLSFVSVLYKSVFDVSADEAAFETSTHCWVQALTEALTSGHLGGAGLDVHWVVRFLGHSRP